MAVTTSELVSDTLKAQDLEEWETHIAWQELVLPAITKERDTLTRMLVEATLTAPQPGQLSREQLAGRIAGIDWFLTYLAGVLRKGVAATRVLRHTD